MGVSPGATCVRLRIAPSPTGNCHVGTERSALYNLPYGRRHGGAFAVRIDDTVARRSTAAPEQAALEGLRPLLPPARPGRLHPPPRGRQAGPVAYGVRAQGRARRSGRGPSWAGVLAYGCPGRGPDAEVERLGWKRGELLMAVRIAVSGRDATPSLFETLEAIGN